MTIKKNIEISVESETRKVFFEDNFLGLTGENLQGYVVFSFKDNFVSGVPRVEIVQGSNKYIIADMETDTENETYKLLIKSSLLTTSNVQMQLVITESAEQDSIPIFKSKMFSLYVAESINAETTIPEEYAAWIDTANAKIAEINQKLEEVDTALGNVDTAIQNAETATSGAEKVNISSSKSGKTTTVITTNRNGEETTNEVLDGNDGEDGLDGIGLQFIWQGTKLGIKRENDSEYQFVDLQGQVGPIGPQGNPFQVKKTYATIELMVADYDNMAINDYVMISGSIEDEDNATLWVKTEQEDPTYKWQYLADFSGASGVVGPVGATPNIQIGTVTSGDTPSVTRTGTNEEPILNFVLQPGPTGATGPIGATGNGVQSITKTSTSGLVDTYTITYTNGSTTTFNVSNGKGIVSITKVLSQDNIDTYRITYNDGTTFDYEIENGSVTQTQFDDLEDRVNDLERNQKTDEATGTEIELTDAFDTRVRYLGIDASETTQETTTGKNLAGYDSGSLPYTNYNLTLSKNEEVYTLNGTANGWFYKKIYTIPASTLNGTYLLKKFNLRGTSKALIRIMDRTVSPATTIKQTSTENTFTITNSHNELSLEVAVSNNTDTFDEDFEILIQDNSIVDTSYEPYTGGNSSPSPDYPQDVETMVGYRNLFNPNGTFAQGQYVDGVWQDNTQRVTSNYIEAETLKTYTIFCDLSNTNDVQLINYNLFDENKNWLGNRTTNGDESLGGKKTHTFTINLNNVKYIKITFQNSGSTTLSIDTVKTAQIQLTEGTEEKPYVPYGTNYMVLDEVGKNLFDKDKITTNVYVNVNGELSNSNNYVASDYIKISNTTICISGQGAGSGAIRTAAYDEEKSFIEAYSQGVATGFSLNLPSNAKYVRFSIKNDSINTAQLEQGSTATPYEPYQLKQYPISLANQELLNKGDYADKIIVDESTGQSYIEKVWGKVVLDGSENWTKGDDVNDNSYYYTPYYDSAIKAITNVITSISDKLTPIPNVGVVIKNNLYVSTTWAHLRLYIDKNIFSGTASEFKTWLASNNITIYHLLATPQLIPIDNPNIKLLNGVNHIINSEGAEMNIVYVKDINAYLDSINARIEALENAN